MRKKLAIAGGITAAVLLLALWAGSAVIESRIVALIEDEIDKDMAADITLASADVSLFAAFPSVRLRLRDLAVVGEDGFAGVPLVEVEEIRVVLDLGSVLFGDAYRITRLALISPHVHVVVDEEGAANYDLWPEGGASDEASSAYHLRLDDLQIDDFGLIYEDRAGGIRADLTGLDHRSTGDVTQDLASLVTHTEVAAVSVRYG
ncbi:MAG: hypothetical protein JRJ84_21800, partial [Deltaproteobacteria bacterium]|nr:hypothetical protein [Deltaproteobacteria bacterium]